MTKYVQVSPDGMRVIASFGSQQAFIDDKPGYAELPDNDQRVLAFQSWWSAQQSVAAALKAGVSITSTSTFSLNGIYACDEKTQSMIVAEALYIQTTTAQGAVKFTNGQTTKMWLDASRIPHTFNPAQFIAFAEAIAQYIDGLLTAMGIVRAGGLWNPPSSSLTIPLKVDLATIVLCSLQ